VPARPSPAPSSPTAPSALHDRRLRRVHLPRWRHRHDDRRRHGAYQRQRRPPDGGGGQISLLSLGSTVVNGVLEVRGPTGETCGGDVCIDTGLDATVGVTGSVDVSGGDAGGAIEFIAGRDVTINGDLDLRGRQRAAPGGDASLRAGNAGTDQLRVSSTIDSNSSASCSPEDAAARAAAPISSAATSRSRAPARSSPPGPTAVPHRHRASSWPSRAWDRRDAHRFRTAPPASFA
jgi:hypothetical protein